MKLLPLEFDVSDLALKPDASGTLLKPAEIMQRVIGFTINQYADQKGGLIKIERGQSYWLRKELEKAVATELKELEVPDDIFGFLRKVFREVKLIPDKLMEKVETIIDAVKMD